MLRSTLLTLALSRVAAHGAMLKPTSRNAIGPGLPMSGLGTGGFQSGNCDTQKMPFPCKYDPNQPEVKVSPCGDPGGYAGNLWFYLGNYSGPIKEGHTATEGPYWENFRTNNNKTMWTKFTPGEKINITFTITAYHAGAMGAYLCPWHPGTNDFDPEECKIWGNKNVASYVDVPRGGCAYCQTSGEPWYNYDSEYFLGMVDLLPNQKLCAGNCALDLDGVQEGSVVLRNGTQFPFAYITLANGKREKCGYQNDFNKVGTAGMVGGGRGCQGPTDTQDAAGMNPPGSSRFTWTSTNAVPKDFPTKDAVLVWHWITDNNGKDASSAEQFMNCADMTSDMTSPIPSAPPPPPAPPALPASPVPTCGDDEKKCIDTKQDDGLCPWHQQTEAACKVYQGAGCEWGCPPSSSASKSSKKSLDQRLEETAHALQAH